MLGWLAWGSLPRTSGEATLPGLGETVEVARDGYGIPHISAASAADAYAALGYVHAQDRLWQMEASRRLVQGRLAELVGDAALPTDRFMRTLGLYRHATAAAGGLAADDRALLEAYARGVNAYLEGWRGPLPPEFQLLWHTPETWTVVDSLAFTRLMALDLGSNWRTELLRARLARQVTPEQLADLFPEAGGPVTLAAVDRQLAGLDLEALERALPPASPPGLGSNVWVVDGTRSRGGKPLLANDPHLGLSAPGIWYLASLQAPGLDVIGGTMPAMPIVVAGRNASLAWGLTNTGPDTQDLFVETLADGGQAYRTPDGPRPFTIREEEIRSRSGRVETLRVRETRHGPVLSDLIADSATLSGPDAVLALAWTALADDDRTLTAGFRLATAGTPGELEAGVTGFLSPQQNVTWASADGQIGLIAPGRVPIRRSGDGTVPAPGADGSHDWTGWIPFPDLPRTVDPAGGQIVNANNRLVGPDYPYLITKDWDPGLRAGRIEAMLGTRNDLDADSFAAMQADIVSPLAQMFAPVLTEAARDMGPPGLIEAIAAWDGTMAGDRPEPLAFAAWYDALAVAIYGDELGPLFEAYRGMRPEFMRRVLTDRPVWCDDIATPGIEESCAERVRLAWERAADRLAASEGPDWRSWRWDRPHRTVMRHRLMERVPYLGPLFRIEVPTGGDGATVAVAPYPGGDGADAFVSGMGPSYRMIVDWGDPASSRFVAATGQSGHPLSPHWDDQTALWASGRYRPMRRPLPDEVSEVLRLKP
ncbi:MAG: penicillin acylase family protein [Geminicoccaceae bacterium]